MWTPLAMAALLAVQDVKAEEFYKLKKGTTWTYSQEGEGGDTSRWTLDKEDGGKFFVTTQESHKGREAAKETRVFYSEDGCLVMAFANDEQVVPYLRLFKNGSKKGDTWDASAHKELKAEATHVGTEEVKVAAGSYKDVVHVRIKMSNDAEMTYDFYLAPRLGILKMEGNKGDVKVKLELKEFKEAK